MKAASDNRERVADLLFIACFVLAVGLLIAAGCW